MDVTKAASVRKVLFERMGLEAPSSKLTKKGKPSTDAEVCPLGPAAAAGVWAQERKQAPECNSLHWRCIKGL